jgi:cytochrome c-type biogenesis protein CcmF
VIVELGHFALILAFFVALVQVASPIGALYTRDARLFGIAESAAPVLFALIGFSFVALVYAHVSSDFSVANVFENSHSAKPLLYKISGVWGNHEGSMLLWVLILVLFGAGVWMFGGNLPQDLRATVLGVQAAISATFIIFIVATSNPFTRIAAAPAEGNGLNPILQDPALAIHPPLLYAGYVGFSMAFSFAIAALILGRVDSAWARWVRPWTLAAWIFLTIGIGVGSWWAYYTLGWGGWWFWDPVENASLKPWLAGTALLHSAIVMEKRDSLKTWTILLAILTFGLSLLGTFLVRSGVITSVHSFASDPARGVFILAIVAAFTAGGFALFAWRASSLSSGGAFALVSRESALVLNNLLLSVCCGIVFTGTYYPIVLEALTGAKITVGGPFYNATVIWLFLPLLAAVPFGMFLAWKRGDLKEAGHRLWPAAIAALLAGAAAAFAGSGFKAALAILLGAWVFAGSIWELLWRAKFAAVPLAETARRLMNMKLGQFAATLGHIGLAVAVIGVAGASVWVSERLLVMKPSESADLAGYTFTFKEVFERQGPNYVELAGAFDMKKTGGASIGSVIASKRRYDAPPQMTKQAGISVQPLGDIYVVLGDETEAGAYQVKLYFHPFVRWIWGGSALMFLAGLISLFDRRLRIGLPQGARKAMPAPAE